jgi:hypothetical protein
MRFPTLGLERAGIEGQLCSRKNRLTGFDFVKRNPFANFSAIVSRKKNMACYIRDRKEQFALLRI